MSLRSCLGDFKDKLFRKKKIDGSNNSDLIRTLSLFSLVCMGKLLRIRICECRTLNI